MSVVVRRIAPSAVSRNVVAEFELAAAGDFGHPWDDIEVDVDFTDPTGAIRSVPAYWAGGRKWCVRYSSELEGRHTYVSRVSRQDDAGLERLVGTLTVSGDYDSNPLVTRGAPRVDSSGRHLCYSNGEPFFWLADTWWSGMTARFRWPDVFRQLADDRAAKGFTVVQIVAGPVPEGEAFSSFMASEGGQAWTERGSGEINPDFFSVPDEKIDYLVASSIVPCIVGAWGYYLDLLGPGRLRKHWRYLVARYGAYPVVWCIAGEVDLTRAAISDSPGNASLASQAQVKAWEEIAQYVGEIDPYRRVRTAHPCPLFNYSTSEAFKSRDSFDLDMLQTGHNGRACVPATMEHLHRALDHGNKPVLNGECSYEGIFDSNWHDIQRFLFWSHMLSGTAGHTYGTMAISTFNSRDDPYVPMTTRASMHFWEDAINWKGSDHVGVGKRVLERIQWWQLIPAPDDIVPHADEKDWFLPYAAKVPSGPVVIYFPGGGVLEPRAELPGWPRSLGQVVIRNLSGHDFRATWINPRTGADEALFDIRPVDGHFELPSSPWEFVMPTGEDWVLLIEPKA